MCSLTKYRRQKGRVSPTEGSALWRRGYGVGFMLIRREKTLRIHSKHREVKEKNAGRDKNLSASERVLLWWLARYLG